MTDDRCYSCNICKLEGKEFKVPAPDGANGPGVALMKEHLRTEHDHVWMASEGLEIR